MNDKQIELVQVSFEQVAPIADQAAELFYGRLFELDPELRPLFGAVDMRQQGKKLMQMLAIAVTGLSRLEMIVPAVQKLGERHVGYGVKNAHYETVGEALLWTLNMGLGDGFTSEVEEAWTAAYTLLAAVMMEAAEAAERPVEVVAV